MVPAPRAGPPRPDPREPNRGRAARAPRAAPQSGAGGVRGRLAAPSLGPLRAQQQGRGIRCRVSRRERTLAGLAAKDAQFSGASNEPGFRPIGARAAELRVLQRAHCARNSRVRAYAAFFRAVSAHSPGWPQKTHNSPAHPTSPVSGRSAHGGRSYVFCSALAATGPASWYWANTNFGAAPCFRRMPIMKRLQI